MTLTSGSVIAAWHFNENTGTTAEDATASNYDLTGVNTPGWGTGKFSYATDLDSASTEYWQRNAGDLYFAANQDFTISVWYKPEDLAADQLLVSKGAHASVNYLRYGIRMNNAGGNAMDFIMHNAAGGAEICSGTTVLSAGNWYNIVASHNSGSGVMKLYVNGKYEATDTIANVYASAEQPFRVGQSAIANNPVNGIIDEVLIFNVVLSDGGVSVGQTATGDIADLYNSGNGIAYPFQADYTFTATALTLSLTEEEPVYIIQVGSLALSSGLTLADVKINLTDADAGILGTLKTRTIQTKYPFVSGLTARVTKQTGRKTALIPQNSNVSHWGSI